MDTIEYYNKYASRIFEDTVDRDMEPQREEFLEELREIDGDTILDLGCGSGRDSLAFYEQGFDVTSAACTGIADSATPNAQTKAAPRLAIRFLCMFINVILSCLFWG